MTAWEAAGETLTAKPSHRMSWQTISKETGCIVPVHMPVALRKRHFTGAILPFLTVL
jgi:hypothetical protein